MEATQEAVALLSLAARKGLIAQDSAVLIKKDLESGVIQPGAKPIADVLVQQGHITATQAELLLSDFAKASGPKVIAGHQLISKLGQGGMGAVFKATQLSMQREVAIKVLAPHLARDKEFVERFVREARAAGKVQHPNVIGCYDVGVDNGTPYMSLELVPGGDAMMKCKAAGGRLSEREALTIIRDSARGLAAIHKAGMIHRDIKPANIFLTEDGVAKIADLGLARSSAGDDKMTQTGATVGSPAYMSPEQAKGAHDLDIRTDIYSLGATLFHLVCGEPPFTASSVFATVAKVINDPLPDPRSRNPSLSQATSALIKKCMAKDRGQRFQAPDQLLEACDGILGGTAVTFVAPTPPASRSDRQRAHPRPHHHERQAAPASKPVGLYVGGGIAAVAVLILVVVAMSGSKPSRAAQSAEPTVGQATPPAVAPTPAQAAPQPSPSVQRPSVQAAPAPAATPPTARDRLREAVEDRLQAQAGATAPAPGTARDRLREAVEDRLLAQGTPAPAPAPAQPAPAPAASEPLPPWSEAGIAAFDQVLAGDLTNAARSARSLPRHLRDAVDAVAASRADLSKTWAAHSLAIVSAKPALAALPAGFTIVGATEKNLTLRDSNNRAEMGFPWQNLKPEDLATLRGIVEADNPSDIERQRFALLDLSAETVAAAPAGDKAMDGLKELLAVKQRVAAEAAAKAEAERLAREAAARQAALAASTDERTRRILRQIAEVTTFDPEVITGPITTDRELKDFVVIAKNASLAGGRLLPTPGALVVNFAQTVGYQPRAIQGLPFISISGNPAQTSMGGRVADGNRYSNAIFYGNIGVDAVAGDFWGCAFIGSALPLPFPLNEVHTFTGQVRPQQIQNSDFVRLKFRDQLVFAGTDKCHFAQIEVLGGTSVRGRTDICAWDPTTAVQQRLNAMAVEGRPLVQLHEQGGRPATLLGGDAQAVGDALDRVLLVWGDRLKVYAD